MKITVSQLRKIIREEVEKTYSQHKKDGWPSCEEPGCSGKMKPNPQSGNKTSLYCSKCGSEKKKAIKLESKKFNDYIREEVERNLGEGYATLGLAQKIAGEYPEEEVVEFLTALEPEGFGFLPDEVGGDLVGFLASLSMKDLNTLDKHFGEKYGMWQSSARNFRS